MILSTIMWIFGLTFAIKYTNEINHHHTNICYVINCTNPTYPDNHNLTITFYLSMSNETNYTKTDWTTDTIWSNYCSNYNKEILCYYDDRQIFDSLRLFNRYIIFSEGILVIYFLSIGLAVLSVATVVIVCQYMYFQNKINYESSHILSIHEQSRWMSE